MDLRGERVALIGADASGFQIGPAIVGDVGRLTVFERTPQWMAPNPATTPWRALGYAPPARLTVVPVHGPVAVQRKLLELVRADPGWAA